MSNVESMHVQHSTIVHLEVTQLVVIQVQAASWKTHNCNSIFWGFFIVNDGLLANLVNPPML